MDDGRRRLHQIDAGLLVDVSILVLVDDGRRLSDVHSSRPRRSVSILVLVDDGRPQVVDPASGLRPGPVSILVLVDDGRRQGACAGAPR